MAKHVLFFLILPTFSAFFPNLLNQLSRLPYGHGLSLMLALVYLLVGVRSKQPVA
ncbi:hypothetical protein [Hymenobacter yonginensis]|uniref:Uncharacterized protein n=1 Tax=Hymenobacter yonginensis TaxID=748197 RepID=A0ABY7PNS9_9BACT|nr:hypothetical protein [Hymenobacter yonginensis]WBO84921.1 hypothetical protein O9Z63_01450 [Hymenobacter yonginensis]